MNWYPILFTGSIITLRSVSADKSDILKNIKTDSWLTTKNFTYLIGASYNVPQCANIFVSDQSAESERIFKKFISIYRFEYILNGTFHGCDSYFFVAGSEDKLLADIESVMTVNSDIEILIVVDNDIEESSKIVANDHEYQRGLLNVSVYANTNVNIAACNGLWTLSDNYLFPRVFKRASSYDEMVHKRGIVNLKGELLHATTLYTPPLSFLKTTVNRTENGIEAPFYNLENETEFDGVEVIFFRLLAKRLNFTYTLRKPSDQYRYGFRNGSHWQGGVIGQMVRRETHFAFGGIWLSYDNYQFSNLTLPWGQIYLHFLVPRPKPHASFWALKTPLSFNVWIAIVAMTIGQSFCIYARAWINPKIPKKYRSFAETWTEMMARLLGTSAPGNIQCLKVELQLWHFFGILMVTAFSSSLAAKLASREYDKRIDTAQDFVEANLTWGRMEYTGRTPSFFDLDDHYESIIAYRCERETHPSERHEKILKGNYAIFGRFLSSAFFPHNYVNSEDLTGYRLMKNSIMKYYATFAVTPWLVDSVNKVFLWMQETGLVQYHVTNVLHRHMSLALQEVLIERDINNGDARVLELTPLGAGFAFYLVGLFISTVVFYLELRSVRGSRTIREVLIDIKKNREIWRSKERNKKIIYSAFKKLKRKRYGFDFPTKENRATRSAPPGIC